MVGSSGRIVIDMDLVNNGEDAYDALAHLTWSPADAFTYIKAVGDKNLDVTCSPITSSSSTGVEKREGVVNCQLGSPLMPSKRRTSIGVHFQLSAIKQQTSIEMPEVVQFALHLKSSNADEAGHEMNNQRHLSLPLRIKTDLYVYRG